jgi:hypothetical protein
MVKHSLILIGLFLFFIVPSLASPSAAKGSTDEPPQFDTYFEHQTLRLDYYHTADKDSELITLDKLYRQGPWSGNPKSLLDTFNNGLYYIKVYHLDSGRLIYSKGFNTYCGEYMTTNPAAKGIKRTYHETARIPYPKEKVRFTLERRDKMNNLNQIFETVIAPDSPHINKEALDKGVKTWEVLKNGEPQQKVDLAFLAEGYTIEEEAKLKQDLETIVQLFFSQEPYKSYKSSFNIYAVFKPSQDSGPDQPTRGVYSNTSFGTTFNSLELPRYMLTESNRAIHDAAAHVPYDLVILMVNSDRYGGGGIYNFYCIFSLHEKWKGYLLLHEFGHAFAGLGDEYYSAAVAYNDFYPKGVEPTDPNLTALLDPNNLKWKHLVKKGTPIPTPWDKQNYEKMNEIDKKKHLAKKKYQGIVGAFEGAGYADKGIYRPMIDCIMFSKGQRPYCNVCKDAVIRMIRYYTR